MACIELRDVSYRYPTSPKKNLKNINLTVESGEFIAVIGRNEAGKTTTEQFLEASRLTERMFWRPKSVNCPPMLDMYFRTPLTRTAV